MVNQTAKTPLSMWGQRITQLEAALTASGRGELAAGAMAPVRQLLDFMTRTPGGPPPEANDLLSRAFSDLKACIVDPGRTPDAALFDEITQVISREPAPADPGDPDAVVAPLLGLATAPANANGGPSPAGAVDATAAAMLAGLGDGADDEIDSLLDTVSGPESGSQPDRMRDELGTLREDEGSEARVFMKGELQPGLLSDLIQLFAQNRETGRLVIESPTGKASLFLAEGQIVDAECGGEVGEKGFYNLMQIREGRFSYQRGVSAQSVRIYRKTQHLIMDTLRLIDESA